MRFTRVALLAIASASCFSGLVTLLPDDDRFSAGAQLAYTATGRSGDTLVVGVITLVATDSNAFSGTWTSHWAPGADSSRYVGGQIGAGTASGWVFANGTIRMVVTDGDTVSRVSLSGARDPEGWHGRWGAVAPGGIRAGGAFTATLQP
jgi:hypothetical protein